MGAISPLFSNFGTGELGLALDEFLTGPKLPSLASCMPSSLLFGDLSLSSRALSQTAEGAGVFLRDEGDSSRLIKPDDPE